MRGWAALAWVLVLVALVGSTSPAGATGPVTYPPGGAGDITDVWTTTTGNVNALTAAAGDTFDASLADSSIPVTKTATLPGTCTEGQHHQDTDSLGSETYVCTATNTWTKLQAQLPVVNMTDFGVLCDSSTDDYSAIIAGLDSVVARRGHFVFPVGVCVYGTTIVFDQYSTAGNSSGILIEGSANDKTRLKYTGSEWGIVFRQAELPSAVGKNIDFIVLRDFSLQVSATAIGGIYSTMNVERSHFSDMRIFGSDGTAGLGILLRNHSMSLFERLSFDSIKDGIRISGINSTANTFVALKLQQLAGFGIDVTPLITQGAGCYASAKPWPCCTGLGTASSDGDFGQCGTDSMGMGNTFIGTMGRPNGGSAARRNINYSNATDASAAGRDTHIGMVDLDANLGANFGDQDVTVIGSVFDIDPQGIASTTFLDSAYSGNDNAPDADRTQSTNLINNSYLRFLEAAANGTNYVATIGPASLASNFTATFPAETGTICTTGSICSGTVTYGDITAVGDCSGPACFDGTIGNSLQFEGTTADAIETILTAVDPTASDKTISLPNATGTVAVSATSPIALSALGALTIVADSIGSTELASTFTATTITSALTGNASTATALFANPSDCSANQFATTIAASGNLTCAQPNFTDLAGTATAAQIPLAVLLAGSSGGQTIIGGTASGDDLTLQSTSDATKGTLFLDDAVELWPSMPDQSTGSVAMMSFASTTHDVTGGTFNVLSIAPTTAHGGGASQLIRMNPTYTFGTGGTVPIIEALRVDGTWTNNAATDPFPTINLFATSVLFDATAAGREPLSAMALLGHGNTYRYSATSGTGSGGSVTVLDDNAIWTTTGNGGTWTSGDAYGLRSRMSVTSETGGTVTVPNRYGFSFADAVLSGAGTETLTSQVAVDIAALSSATTNIGIRNADTTVFTPPTTVTVGAAFSLTATATTQKLDAAAARTSDTTTAIVDGVSDGQLFVIINVDTTPDIITIDDGGNTDLGGANCALNSGGTLTVMWVAVLSNWVKISCSPN